jgi:hypothetical protein
LTLSIAGAAAVHESLDGHVSDVPILPTNIGYQGDSVAKVPKALRLIFR